MTAAPVLDEPRPHGTRARYVTERCRCDACREANRVYASRRNRERLAEQWGAATPRLVPADRVREHLARLREAGLGLRTVQRRSGVSRSTLSGIAGVPSAKTRNRVTAESEARILAVQPQPDMLAGGVRVPSAPTARRLQALAALGWSLPTLAARLGWSASVARHRAYATRPSVQLGAARQVADLYEQLSGTPGPSARIRAAAARRGWQPPLAWDDIDAGVLAEPEQDAGCARCDDIFWCFEQGMDAAQAATRLGFRNADGVRTHLRRHGHPEPRR